MDPVPWHQWFCCSSAAGPAPGLWDSWGKNQQNNKKQTKAKLSFLSSCVPQNKKDSDRRWTGTMPAKPIMFLTLQGNSVIHGLRILPGKGTTLLEQGVLHGFGSVLSFLFISVHPGVLISFPCCICCTQSCHIWAQGNFPVVFWAGFAILLHPSPGLLHLQHPQNPTRAHLGRWGGCMGGWGCTGSPSQIMNCHFQVAGYPETHRLGVCLWGHLMSVFPAFLNFLEL